MDENIIILFIFTLIFISGCSDIELPCMMGWHNETHFCNEYHRMERIPVKENTTESEFKTTIKLETTDEPGNMEYLNPNWTMQPKASWGNPFGEGYYCYVTPDRSQNTHCTCDILVYPDGHNETRKCICYDDLVMNYKCINLTEQNITLLKGVEING